MPTMRETSSIGMDGRHAAADGVIGASPAWQEVVAAALRVANTDTTVLLHGESGTGKEVIARLIHRASPRRNGPLVAINCAALPEQLLESELFGYERGAFSGAYQPKVGHIELAARGVLFLDEVSEMNVTVQAKFLRVLEEREFRRLGGTCTQKADVRIIAASNRDLHDALDHGTIRADLLYRLLAFDIALPPLRDRASDIPLLAEHFLHQFARTMKRPVPQLCDDARKGLLAHDWPGNIRELRNAIERAVILSDGNVIEVRHLSLRSRPCTRAQPIGSTLSDMERSAIERALHEAGGNKAQAARRLGLSRTQLYGRLRRYGLEDPPSIGTLV